MSTKYPEFVLLAPSPANWESSIIIFDEATRALDTITEGQILSSLNLLKNKRTMITVTHRYKSIERCNKVIKLNNGRIEQIGLPEDIF